MTQSFTSFIKRFGKSRNPFSKGFLAAGGLSLCILLLFFLAGCRLSNQDQRVQKLSLDRGWTFREKDKGNWLPARVPGCVHVDLLNNNLIPDPFYRDHEKELQWIEEREWTYEKVFMLDKDFLEKSNIELIFYGLDTYAKVFLNDRLIITADNMFRKWEVAVKSLLREGENRIHVHFLVPKVETFYLWQGLGYELPGGEKVMTRKAGYHYGWDWGPRFVTCGIWQPVELQAWDRARIKSIYYEQLAVSPEVARINAHFEVFADSQQRVELVVAGNDEKGRKDFGRLSVQLWPGINNLVVPFEIIKPRLWWTNGLGESYLYTFKNVIQSGQRSLDVVTHRLGVRTVEVVVQQDRVPNGSYGETFYFKLNGVPVFMKGANCIPLDSFPSRVSARHYRALVNAAHAANMNMLRVWGGGIYESDLFYDYCDEAGILVWQDFMFACAMYPGSDAFVESVKQEAIEQVKRLRNHPCIALWCGNNEIAEAWHMWGWQPALTEDQRQRIWEDYIKLFHGVLPAVVNRYDPVRYYWPSSPKFGRGFYRSLYEGDLHYWGVWHDAEPFSIYKEKIGRFMSEYGFQSLPAMSTIGSFALPEEQRLDSEVMKAHQKHPRGNELIEKYMKRDLPRPGDFPQLVYYSQVLQAEGMRTAIEAHRRAMPYCMGTLYWQFNDCWPVVSWSGMDYYGNWKALHYFARKAFAPIIISSVEEAGQLKVFIVSDRLFPVAAVLHVRLVDMSGKVAWKKEVALNIAANTSQSVFAIEVKELLKGQDKQKVFLFAELKQESTLLASQCYYFVPIKELKLVKPVISQQVNGLSVTLQADTLAKAVYLTVEGEHGNFSDNFFDLMPGRPVTVYFNGSCSDETFKKKLKIESINR